MIYDTLGILIGFVYVMLILSIAVTAIVEATQNFFRLRMRNLFNGLDNLFNSELFNEICPIELKEEKKIETKNLIAFVKFVPQAVSGGPLRRIIDFFTPQIDRIEVEDIIHYLKAKELDIEDRKSELVRKFRSMEYYLSESFKIKVKLISLVTSLIVAFVFQINTFDFIQKLSTDATYRNLLVSMAEGQFGEVEHLSEITSDREVFQKTLKGIIKEKETELDNNEGKTEKDKANKAQFSTELEALKTLLSQTEKTDIEFDSNAVEKQFLAIFPNDKDAEEKLDDALDETRLDILSEAPKKIVSRLNAFSEIRPFPNAGLTFYKSFDNWLGALTTAILISLGAHFWFDTLKTLLGLRDKLQKPTPAKSTTED